MKRSPPPETQLPRRRPRINEVSNSDEVLSMIEDCKGKLLEFQKTGTRLTEALTTAKSYKEAHDRFKAIKETVERNLNAIEQPLNSVFSIGSAQAANLETTAEDLLNIEDTMGLVPGFLNTPNEAEGSESIPSKLKAEYQDLYQPSKRPDQVLQKSLMETKLQLMKSASEGLHRGSLKKIQIDMTEVAAISTFYRTAFGTETISASRAQYICLRHESFICYVELSVAGSATPIRVHIHGLKRPSKITKTFEADPRILEIPSIPVLQEIELLMNEALDWYWDRALKKYLLLESEEQRRQQIPGFEVLKCTLLFACTLRGVIQNVSSALTSLSNKTSSPLIGYSNYKLDKSTLELKAAAMVSTRIMFPR